MGPSVRDVTFFASKEVGWSPVCVTSRFYIKGGRLGPRVRDVTFFAPKGVSWSLVFLTLRSYIKGGRLGPRVCDVTFFCIKRGRWSLVFVTLRFLHQRRFWPRIKKMLPDRNIARIAKSFLHKLLGKSILNVSFVCRVCENNFFWVKK